MAARTLILCILVTGASSVRAEGLRPEKSDLQADPPGDAGLDPKADLRRIDSHGPAVRRPVAVIDLTNDQAVRDVANKLLERLAVNPDLAPPAISDAAALVDKLPPDDELRITQAQR
jgi:hypothetical protein